MDKILKIFTLLTLAIILGAYVWYSIGEENKYKELAATEFNLAKKDISIIDGNNNNKATYNVEVADNKKAQRKGLMFRKTMKENKGMLFIFDNPHIANFWMKNTYISLDIIFIDEDGYIVNIAENTKPMSTDRISSKSLIKYVLEVNAGQSAKHVIKIGDKIEGI